MAAPCAASRLPPLLRGRDPASGPAEPIRRWAPDNSSLFLIGTMIALLSAGCSERNLGNEWFPLRDGEQQVYEVVTEMDDTDQPPVTERWTLTTRGPTTWDGQAHMRRHHSAGISYFFRVDEGGMRRVATQTDIDGEPTPDSEPVWVLRAPYGVGTEWSGPTVPYLILRRNEHPRELKYTHKAQMNWRIEAVDEVVETPAGRHSPCLRVVGEAEITLYTDAVNGFTVVPLISREWYCRGQGLVRFEREERVPRGFLTGGVLKAERVR